MYSYCDCVRQQEELESSGVKEIDKNVHLILVLLDNLRTLREIFQTI